MSAAWSKESLEALKALAGQGLSASQIAGQMGVSRNAVIGKIHRCGIALRGHMHLAADRPAKPKREPKVRAAPIRHFLRRMVPEVKPPTMIAPEPPPPEGGVALIDIGHGECRWPLGDPLSPDFRFCGGAVRQGAYCAAHARLAYAARGEAAA